jgi:voltage-gated sodium channel
MASSGGDDLAVLVRELSEVVRQEQKTVREALTEFANAQRELAEQVARVTDASNCGDEGEEDEDAKYPLSMSPRMSPEDSCEAADREQRSDQDPPAVHAEESAREGSTSPHSHSSRSTSSRMRKKKQLAERLDGTPWWRTVFTRAGDSFAKQGSAESLGSGGRRHGVGSDSETVREAKNLAFRIVSRPEFSWATSLVIFVNSVIIGVEIEMDIQNQDSSSIQDTENIFLLIYIVELSLRFLGIGRRSLRNPWTVFDLVLVIVGVATTWILLPILRLVRQGGGGTPAVAELLQQVLIFRTVRLLRLVRALRLIGVFKPLWKLVQGMLNSMSTMFSALVLILLTIYIFACIGGELITKPMMDDGDSEVSQVVRNNFGNLLVIMMTLGQFVTMDSIAQIYTPLVHHNPYLVLYFGIMVMLVSVTLMNLVTAIIVEDSIARANADAEMEQHYARQKMKQLTPAIRQVFHQLDTSSDGAIQIKEIISGVGQLTIKLPTELQDVLKPDKLVDLFEFLDLDGSGELTEVEFVEGVSHLALMNVPVETTQTLQLLRHQRRKVGSLHESVDRVHNHVTRNMRKRRDPDSGAYRDRSRYVIASCTSGKQVGDYCDPVTDNSKVTL